MTPTTLENSTLMMAQGATQVRGAKRIQLKLPGPLKSAFKVPQEFSFEGETLVDVLRAIEGQFPGFMARLTDETGKLRPFIRLFVNGVAVDMAKDGNALEIRQGDALTLMLAMAGG